jgi:hypothetical protein
MIADVTQRALRVCIFTSKELDMSLEVEAVSEISAFGIELKFLGSECVSPYTATIRSDCQVAQSNSNFNNCTETALLEGPDALQYSTKSLCVNTTSIAEALKLVQGGINVTFNLKCSFIIEGFTPIKIALFRSRVL